MASNDYIVVVAVDVADAVDVVTTLRVSVWFCARALCVCNSPEGLFRCVFAEVAFVDVLQSMSDPSIPLTVGEWEEWGNPNEREHFEYMSRHVSCSHCGSR